MATAVRLPDEIVGVAKKYAKSSFRSLSKQVEYWMTIGKIVDENPQYSSMIKPKLIETREEIEVLDLPDDLQKKVNSLSKIVEKAVKKKKIMMNK